MLNEARKSFILFNRFNNYTTNIDYSLYGYLFQLCKQHCLIRQGKQLHARLILCSTTPNNFLGSKLISFYLRNKRFKEAHHVFEEIPERDLFSWNALMIGYASENYYVETLKVFYSLLYENLESPHLKPDNFTVTCVLKAVYGVLGDSFLAKMMHGYVVKNGFDSDAVILNGLIDCYLKSGDMEMAKNVFDEIPERDGISWNSIISGYSRCDYSLYGHLLQLCKERCLIRQGKQTHARLVLSSTIPNNFLASKLINFYAKNKHLKEAHHVFNEIPEKNTFSWNALMIGYSSENYHVETLKLFSSFLSENLESRHVKPDNFTVTCVLKAVSGVLGDSVLAKMIHCYVVKNGFDSDLFVLNGLITSYSKSVDMVLAKSVFDEIPEKDVVSWNSMISGYFQCGFYEECKGLYREMLQLEGFGPDGVTVVSVLQACAQSNDLILGMEIHQYVIENGIEVDISVFNSIIALYSKCGSLDYARELFEEMGERDEITYGTMISGYMNYGFVDKAVNLFREMEKPCLSTWNALLSGLVQNNLYERALELVREMRLSGVQPNAVTLSSILPGISDLAFAKGGKEVHAYAIKSDCNQNIFVATGVIDIYAKLGFIQSARQVFDHTKDRSVIIWTAIISAYANHGDAKAALDLLNVMLSHCIWPDSVTFTAVLAACAHSGLIEEAWRIFELLEKYGIQPLDEHYACMVGVLSRAGKLSEAIDFIRKMSIEPSARVWGALLNGASVYGDVEVGRFACSHLFEMEPESTGNSTIMANLYSKAGRWEEAQELRKKMKRLGLKKIIGSSWMETCQGVKSFVATDESNEKTGEVYGVLESLLGSMRDDGSVMMDEFKEETM
ncbi:Pentatricopeptide repeat-containing protein [Capsicum chinense]|nr:Pentatricopeptide repeat-containing protein [Capsicum chinense]